MVALVLVEPRFHGGGQADGDEGTLSAPYDGTPLPFGVLRLLHPPWLPSKFRNDVAQKGLDRRMGVAHEVHELASLQAWLLLRGQGIQGSVLGDDIVKPILPQVLREEGQVLQGAARVALGFAEDAGIRDLVGSPLGVHAVSTVLEFGLSTRFGAFEDDRSVAKGEEMAALVWVP